MSFAPPHVHDEVQLGLQREGRARFVLEGQVAVELTPGAIVVVPAGCVHAVSPVGTRPSAFVHVNVSPVLERRILEGKRLTAPKVIPPAPARELAALLQEPLDHDAVVELVIGVEHAASRPLAATPPPRWLVEVRGFVEARATTRLSLDAVAEMAGRSKFYVARSFRRHFETSLHAYILGLRINRVRKLVRAGASLADAAVQSGFSDQAHMTRAFVRFHGVTPAAWRAGSSKP